MHVVAFRGHEFLGFVRQVNLIAYLLYALVEPLQLHVDDALDGIKVELVEGDNLVEAVQELRRELL